MGTVAASDTPLADPRTSVLRLALWASAAVVALLYFGPAFVSVFRPQPDTYSDFVQEWLSARNFWAGDPVYSPQHAAMLKHTGIDLPAFASELPWNAHPPVAVLVALPFGQFADYATAHFAWNLGNFFLFVLSLVLVARELRIEVQGWMIFAALALVVSWNAVLSQLYQGQLNFMILFLLVVAWVADRRGYQTLAGASVGAAAAMKIFPALLLVYFVATGRWRAVAATLLAGLLLHVVALLLFGPTAFETYVRDVLPSLNVFQGSWLNVSLTGYWKRVGVALGVPMLGRILAVVCQFLVVVAVWWVSRRAARAGEPDRAFALVVVGMLLASPVAWVHYFVLLTLPLLIFWQRLSGGPARVLLLVVGVVLWLPERFVPGLLVGRETADTLSSVSPMPGGVDMAFVGLGPFTYALVALFLLVGFARLAPAPAAMHAPEPVTP
jgi:hypothetical protein